MSVDETFLGSMPLFEVFVRDLGEVQQQEPFSNIDPGATVFRSESYSTIASSSSVGGCD
jgi:hypothetical protein